MALTVNTALLEALAPAGTPQASLDAAYTAAEGDVNAAALVLWWDHRSNIMSSPLSWSAQGDYSEDRTKNVDEVNNIVRQLEQTVGVGASAAGLSSSQPMLSSAPVRRLGREGLFVGDPYASTPATVVTDLSNDQLWIRLQAIADAVAQAELVSYQNTDVDLVADTPLVFDLTILAEPIGEVVVVQILDDLDMEVTSGIEVTVEIGQVTLESGTTVNDYTLNVLGHPPV